MTETPHEPLLPACRLEDFDLPIFANIHRVRAEIIASLEDSYSLEQLRAPRINVSVVRPLVHRLWTTRDISLVFCLLVNRLQFLREQAFQGHQSLNTSRAQLCELIAMKLLRRFDEHSPGMDGLLLLSNIMCAGFAPFHRASSDVLRAHSLSGRKSTTLEVAILSDSKMLIASSACQRVMAAIYVGQVVYTPSSVFDILPDHYKHKPITLYRPELAPLLDQYRLMVPRTRNLLDIGQFLLLLLLYLLLMQNRHSLNELLFAIYALGWVLDELASILEHGWHCYTQNLWSFLDAMSASIFVVYFVLRLHSLGQPQYGPISLDILSAAAPVLIPRLAFNLMSENMLFVSLRAMMADFTVLTLLAVWCFTGFLLSLWWLSGDHENAVTISKWMLFVWFGLDGTGIDKSAGFHWLIGPILMVTFAFLGNTLFLTILVSMLTSTFSKIATNANAEIQFRRAVLTFEGVKSDTIFAYQPPFNVLALLVVLPLKLIFSPRWFHKINVAIIRTLNAPLLLAIGIYERRYLWSADGCSWFDLSRFSVHSDLEDVFAFDQCDVPEARGAARRHSEHEENQDTRARLEGLEKAVGRIEAMLTQLQRP